MNRLTVSALIGTLLLPLASGAASGAAFGTTPSITLHNACAPSPTVLKALATPVGGLTSEQVQNATTIINAAAAYKVPERGQTIAVMTALEASSLGAKVVDETQGAGAPGIFGPVLDQASTTSQPDAGAEAKAFYQSLKKVRNWQNLPPTLAAHAAQHNLDPEIYAPYYAR